MDEEEEVEWVSHYHCRLFPVNRPHRGSVEKMKPIWRRNHIEGPIHDSWSELRLDVDESNNRLLIVESRREWQGGNSSSQRTHYIQQLPSPTSKDGLLLTELSEDSDMDQIEQVEGETDLLQRHGLNLSTNWEMPSLSDVDWRPPRQRHVSDDAAPLVRSFLLASTKFRYYNPSCASFLDIVDDALSLGDSSSSVLLQRLRLRVGSRRQGGICRDEQGMLIPPKIDPNTGKELHGSNESWPSRGVRLWPDEDDEELSDILNPTPTLGLTDVKAASDERSVVYLAGPTKSNKRSLVMVNFDASIKLPNTRRRKGGRLEPGQGRAAKGKQKGVAETPEGRQGNDCKWSWLEPARYMSIDKGLWLR
ncbi:MAG: hypothetical protein M1825_002687 [Sarcosagium campestre]|nr:MAG: hypothetical protein M1825_002687 [Sarcosagium campestre]